MKKNMMVIAVFLAGIVAYALPPRHVELWPEGKIPSKNPAQTKNAILEFSSPEKKTTDAMIILAGGGGYNGCSGMGDCAPMRDYLLAKGMNVAILFFRTPRAEGYPIYHTPWQDAQRAVRIVRSQAKERGYSPDKIGFMGFSAGGHLTLLMALSSLTKTYEPIDDIDKLSCSINWGAPVYPAYILSDGLTSANKKRGEGDDIVMTDLFKFDEATAPLCLFHGTDDEFSPIGSVRVYERLRKMNIPVEMHLMACMPHCYFMSAHDGEPGQMWKDRVWEWLMMMGIVTIHPNTWKIEWEWAVRTHHDPDMWCDIPKGSWSLNARAEIVAEHNVPLLFKGTYKDFILDFEYAYKPGLSQMLHIPGADVKLINGTGSAEKWNRITLWCEKGKYKCAINGKWSNEAIFKTDKNKDRISIDGADFNTLMRVRNVRICELPARPRSGKM